MSQPARELRLPESHTVECFKQNPLSSLPQIWCFGHAGAGSGEFTKWPEYAGSSVLICAVRLPGRERRLSESSLTRMDELAAMLAAEIGPLLSAETVFYGQCLGALVALETVAELQRLGGPLPRRLFAASQTAPGDSPVDLRPDPVSDAEFRQMLVELGWLPPRLADNDEFWEIVEPGLRADYELLNNYLVAHRHSPVLGIAITALVGSADRLVSAEDLWGWRAHTSKAIDVTVVPGGGHLLSRTSGPELVTLLGTEISCSRSSARPGAAL